MGPAVDALVSSMRDSIIAVDLEWIQDSSPAMLNPVAMLQLASSSCVLLVRICRMQRRREMPPALLDLLRHAHLACDQGFLPRTVGTNHVTCSQPWSAAAACDTPDGCDRTAC